MEERLLNGWKEIGSYLGRAVRTAQRWECQFDMPIHRPATRKRTAVIAFSHELDGWLTRNCSRLDSFERDDVAMDLLTLSEKLSRLQTEAAHLAAEIRRVRDESPQLLERDLESMPDFGERPD